MQLVGAGDGHDPRPLRQQSGERDQSWRRLPLLGDPLEKVNQRLRPIGAERADRPARSPSAAGHGPSERIFAVDAWAGDERRSASLRGTFTVIVSVIGAIADLRGAGREILTIPLGFGQRSKSRPRPQYLFDLVCSCECGNRRR